MSDSIDPTRRPTDHQPPKAPPCGLKNSQSVARNQKRGNRSCELTPGQCRASGASTAQKPPDTHIDDAAILIGNPRISAAALLEASIVLESRAASPPVTSLTPSFTRRGSSWRRSQPNTRRPRGGRGADWARATTRRD